MKKKILIISIILITIINTILPVVNAVPAITKANLINDHKINTYIEKENENGWFEVICNYICYKEDGKKYPAYCIEPGIHGVDEEGNYTVTVDDLVKDKLIYNTLLNGYPYKTHKQLGLESSDDAYVATKLALRSVLLNTDVKTYLRAKNERGEKIINAICEIAEKGRNGNNINKEAVININKSGDFKESGDYYYQEYSVIADANISEYEVKAIENFPEGAFITNEKGEKQQRFYSNEQFRIMVPKTELEKDISGKINVIASCKTNPIFYGKASSSTIQDYAITYKPYVEYEANIILNEKTNTASVKIIKQDEETFKPIDDVLFGIYNENNELITQQKTDKDGITIFDNLYQGKYSIKEIEANKNYEKDETIYEINTEYNKQVIRTITNTHKKGNLIITKVDKDDNSESLDGIEFDLIDSENNVVAHLITDINGKAQINNINIGTYTLKETKTKENYNLCEDNNINVKWNETKEIVIENEKKKGLIKIIKQDAENKEIKLEGVEFEIFDINSNLIESIKTNSNGEGISNRLPVGEYIIKEINLGENSEYILEEKEYKIHVENEKINEVVIENMHKKGNLKITKVDKDDKTITLGAIEFDVIDEKGNTIANFITDVNGEAYIENINTGIYTLKETLTKRDYNLCENKNIVVEWNETKEIVIENEKKKGQIKIIKQDEENSEIKLEGVKFQILDVNDKIIEEVQTDKNGEAVSSKLLIGEYKIKEIDLGNNINYLLNNEVYTVQVENEVTANLLIKNKHKKGNLRIIKVDKDNSEIKLEGVKFEITDKEGKVYKITTDENGIAKIENVRIGKVTIKELETNEKYILSNQIYEAEIEYNEDVELIIENEKKKGQIKVNKVDKDNNNIKIENVEFQILNKNNEVVDILTTNVEGVAVSKKLPIGEYYLKEIATNSKYVLDANKIQVTIEEDKITNIVAENEKKKGKIQIIKTSSNDSPILNIKKGEYLQNVEFEIFNESGTLVDVIVTDENGQGISKDLEIGRYKVKEKSTNKYYILNTNEFFVNIKENGKVEILEIQNEAIIPNLDIEKTGQQYAEKNEEIKYEFDIKNNSNTKLDNFTWIEFLPYNNSKITKIVTGIYNENLDYEIYYKTNKNDYRLFKTVNSKMSQYLSFDTINLEKKEVITEIKVEYKTVSENFSAIVKPSIITKIDSNVKNNEKIINITELSGNIEEYVIKDKSEFETIIKEKEILKKLPKTGC